MDYQALALSPEELAAMDGPVLLDFGTNWCGWCRSARPLVEAALARHGEIRHVRIEDGPGRRLGRRFGVRLWPTLILLRGGEEQGRVVRPGAEDELEALLAGCVGPT